MPFIPNVDLTVIKRLFGAVEQPGPFVVSDVISPVIEIQNLALMQRRERLFDAVNASGIGTRLIFTVDDGEFWLVHTITTNSDILDADQAAGMQLVLIPPPSSGTMRLGQPVSIAALEHGGVGKVFTPDLILPPLWSYGVGLTNLTVGAAGSITMSGSTLFTRIRL